MKPAIVLGLILLATGCGSKVTGGGSGAGGSAAMPSTGSVGVSGSTGAGASSADGAGATDSSSGSGIQDGGTAAPHAVCGDEFVDFDCDGQLQGLEYGCPAEQHLDLVDGDHCASCVADTAESETCAWGRSRYSAFLTTLATASCADFCSTDADCFVLTISNSCWADCSFALFGGIDEEVLIAGNLFAAESCTSCPDAPPACPSSARATPACVDHRCVLR